MNEGIYNLLILGGYVGLGHLIYWGYEWVWWKYVEWCLKRSSRPIKRHRNKRPDAAIAEFEPEVVKPAADH